ncbi:ABC transporter permease [Croceicoccus naphthovorans]|uniref:Membrane protein n=1 Tax=Croceicoccus naphthovorans TaxID=1348774 RepID=A0A0G3XFU6_9SPHN|nr:ABC transporter permease [Croceicoccus naphthovorans]AKM09504.1 membrane protein [Croceicoccus naphthovorans]MBB3989760.1 ABC-2 type transport system permease protein [Croceicoccus naphthovorans]
MTRSARTRRMTAMIAKEARQISRDPSTFLIAFLLPIILLFLMGFGVNLDSSRTRIGIAIQDDGAEAMSLATTFARSQYFEVVDVAPLQVLEKNLVSEDIRGIVVIPADFGRDAARGGGQIEVITDGSLPNAAAFIGAYAEGVHAAWQAQRAGDAGQQAEPPIDLLSRFWFNPELASRNFLVPGSIALIMTLIGALLTALVVAREWERGTLEGLMATPVGMGEFLLSKVIPYFVLGIVSMALCTVLAVTLFGVPFRGSVFALFVISSVYLIPALGQGLFISSALKNQFVASQVALLTAFLPTMLLSGFIFEISSMPVPIQALTYLVPARYLMPQVQTVFVAGDDWGLFAPNMAILLAFGVVLFALCVRVTKRRIA